MVQLRMAALVLSLTVLSGCGVDGEPVQPSLNAGISITPNGVSPNVGVGLRQGPFSILFGL